MPNTSKSLVLRFLLYERHWILDLYLLSWRNDARYRLLALAHAEIIFLRVCGDGKQTRREKRDYGMSLLVGLNCCEDVAVSVNWFQTKSYSVVKPFAGMSFKNCSRVHKEESQESSFESFWELFKSFLSYKAFANLPMRFSDTIELAFRHLTKLSRILPQPH